jgi:hypothetical protein
VIIDDALVIKVTDQILKLIKASGGLPTGTDPAGTGPAGAVPPANGQTAGISLGAAKPPLMIVGPTAALSEKCLAALAERFSLVPISGLDQRGRPKAPLLVTSLGLQALVQVASGDEGCTEEGRAILSALLESRPVAALEAGVAWRAIPQTAPRGLVSLYRKAEATLVSFGLKIVPESGLLRALGSKPGSGYSGSSHTSPGCLSPTAACPTGPGRGQSRRVLTESVVKNLFPEGTGGPLELSRGDVLTPLARDWLSANRIAIVGQ